MDLAASREKLLHTAYASFNARNIDAALATMIPAVDWPNGMEGGYVHGHDEIRAYWTRQWGLIDPTVTPVRFAHSDNEVVVDVRQLVRDLTGTTVADVIVQHAYQFDGSLIRFMEIRHPAEGSDAA